MIRGKILFLSLSAIGVLAAILSLIEMWTYFLDWDVFLKIMLTRYGGFGYGYFDPHDK